ncbi:unnamed protein product [Rhizoctonia solani]|uniref:Uncharacterized protein n=1 Tax=Rhizoctonia solani TaxID=456999 RepID=A0A8H3BBZ9_9AGAM|nr:unnamed protein product [Rhizoctonia solani]
MLHPSVPRLLTIFFVLLAFSVAVLGAPFDARKDLVARDGTCLVCTTGTDILKILAKLRSDLQPKLQALDGCYTSGTDPTVVMADMIGLVNTAATNMKALPTDLTGLLNGKGAAIVDDWTGILSDCVVHFAKWNNDYKATAIGDIFAGLVAQVVAALSTAQGAISGAVGGLSALGSQLLDAAKPHWEQLQEQLVGHGLNVLGSLSEAINNLHGSITGGSP